MLGKLRSGEWSPGDRIPTEAQLAEQFAVSIGTVRKAVEDLVAERVLIRRARIGTTVAVHTDEYVFANFFNFVTPAGARVTATAQLLAFEQVQADAATAARLGIPEGAPLARIDNLRLCNGVPAMLDRISVPQDRFPGLAREAFVGRKGSIYGFYQERYATTVVLIQEQVTALCAPDFAAKALGLAPLAPVLKVQRTAFTYGDEAVEYRDRFVNPEICHYQNEVGLWE
jgi:GntR family transcriptional regulator